MVLLFHFVRTVPPSNWVERAFDGVTKYGSYGVELFFVLSGFLITGILYDTCDNPHYFRNFHMKPVLRISPALLWRSGAGLLRGPADRTAARADSGLPARTPSVGVAIRRQHLHRQAGGLSLATALCAMLTRLTGSLMGLNWWTTYTRPPSGRTAFVVPTNTRTVAVPSSCRQEWYRSLATQPVAMAHVGADANPLQNVNHHRRTLRKETCSAF